jgi:putative solute:sodium symporter small subunit
MTTAARASYWRRTLHLTWVLLVVWFVASFVLPYGARDLQFSLFGWPFSFWFVAQGAPLLFWLVVACYAVLMNRLDHAHGVAEDD